MNRRKLDFVFFFQLIVQNSTYSLLISFPLNKFFVFDDEMYCPDCRLGAKHQEKPVLAAPTDTSTYLKAATRISRHHLGDSPLPSPTLDLTLWDLGIPQLHILSVTDAQGRVHSVELTGDIAELLADWD